MPLTLLKEGIDLSGFLKRKLQQIPRFHPHRMKKLNSKM
jgi:hypothetical protein